MNFDISILCRFCFFPLQPTRLLPDLTVIGVIGGCLTRSRNCLPFVITWVHLGFFVGVGVAHFFLWCVEFLYVLCLCPVSCVLNVTSVSGLSLRFTLLFIESTYYNKVSPHFLLLIYCSLCLSWTQEDGVFICIRLYLHFIGTIHSKYNYRKCCFSEQRQMSFFIGSTVLVSRDRCLYL